MTGSRSLRQLYAATHHDIDGIIPMGFATSKGKSSTAIGQLLLEEWLP